MIYIENKEGVQRLIIPTNNTNVEFVNFVPQEGDSDYYTKEQTDKKIAESKSSTMNEVDDLLSNYPTTEQMNDAISNVSVDLTGYATESYVDAGDEHLQTQIDEKSYRYDHDIAVLQVYVNDIKTKDGGYTTKSYVDEEIRNIPLPDMSEYYTKTEIDKVKKDLDDKNYDQDVHIATLEAYVDNIKKPLIVDVEDIYSITASVFNQLYGSYNQGIPTYIHEIYYPNQLMPVIGTTGDGMMRVIYQDEVISYFLNQGNVSYKTTPLHAKVYKPDWDDTLNEPRVTNQMVYDIYNSYIDDQLLVRVVMNNDMYTVYFVKGENNAYTVFMLGANEMITLTANMDFPDDYAVYEKTTFGAGGGIEPLIVDVSTSITKTIFDKLFKSYDKGIPTYIRNTNIPYLIPVVGIRGSLTGSPSTIANLWVLSQDTLYRYNRRVGRSNITSESFQIANAADYYTRVDVISIKNDLQTQITDNKDSITGLDERLKSLETNVGSGGGSTTHKYEYTLDDDVALTGSFTYGEPNDLFNDVKNGVDVYFKLITHNGSRKNIPFIVEYDINVDKINFWFWDFDSYISFNMDNIYNVSMGRENKI